MSEGEIRDEIVEGFILDDFFIATKIVEEAQK